MDQRIGRNFQCWDGYGGLCFPGHRRFIMISEQLGVPFNLLGGAAINAAQKERF
jgi:UDP-glucose 6-dehydrogenase